MRTNDSQGHESPARTRQSDSPELTSPPLESVSDAFKDNDKPAIVYLENGRSIKVDHHIPNETGIAVVVDRDQTDSGVDLKIPYEQITAIEKKETRAGKKALAKLMGWD